MKINNHFVTEYQHCKPGSAVRRWCCIFLTTFRSKTGQLRVMKNMVQRRFREKLGLIVDKRPLPILQQTLKHSWVNCRQYVLTWVSKYCVWIGLDNKAAKRANNETERQNCNGINANKFKKGFRGRFKHSAAKYGTIFLLLYAKLCPNHVRCRWSRIFLRLGRNNEHICSKKTLLVL